MAAALLDASVVRASDDVSPTVASPILAAHPIIPTGHIATLLDNPQVFGGVGHPSVRGEIILLAVVAAAFVILVLTLRGT